MERRNISRYRIIRQLGKGGMGEVFLAEDPQLERKAALKLLSPELATDPERLSRFRREAKAIAALNHPNIVTIYSVEEENEVPFLTMELVEGSHLGQVIPEGGLSLEQFFDIAVPLADALSAAHRGGITHRDLKPANVMVSQEGRVKILDFGLAKLLESEPNTEESEDTVESLTTEGQVLGTVPYMSPEQVKGKLIDHRSDIFSLGVLLYEMATGARPFKGETAADLISSILRDEPPSVTRLNVNLPRHLGRIIRQCLEKNPADRFQTALDVRNQLRALRRELALEGAFGGGEAIPLSTTGVQRRPSAMRLPLEMPALLSSRLGLTLLLAIVFAVNYVETAVETKLRATFGVGTALADRLAWAVHWLEGHLSFEGHEATHALAVYGNSAAYFFLFPFLGLVTGLALMRRQQISPYRVFCLSIAIVYAISLPFFIFFPVPERWSYPEAEATLLSDQWSSMLIETFRPISGLDNCFPSFHVSLTVVIVLIGYLYRVRLRNAVLVLGTTVLLATFVLGIHWIADIAAGLAVGVISVALARRFDRRLGRAAA